MVWVVANATRILAGIVGLSILAILFTSRPTTHLTKVVNRPDSLRIIDDIVERWLTKETSDLQNMEESLRSARSHV
jgi:hypothetical protein